MANQRTTLPNFAFAAIGTLVFSVSLPGQEISPSAAAVSPPVLIPVKLDISRKNLKNFLTDEEALSPYRSSDGKIRELKGVFMIGSEDASFAVFWDSLSCRMLGVIDISRPEESGPTPDLSAGAANTDHGKKQPTLPSPYVLKASGPAQFSGPTGKPESPVYFGFRLVEGKPEFLYTSGSLAVEERIWLVSDGTILKQRFSVREAGNGFRLVLPPEWKERMDVSSGTWKDNTLTVPADSATEVILTYRLSDPEPQPAENN